MQQSAKDVPEALRNYLLMWNELNPEKIRGHLDRCIAEGCLWTDPQYSHVGRNALEQNVRTFREKFGTAQLLLASNVDGHHKRFRYEWLIKQNGKILIHGFDVTTLNSEGLIERVDGFFGRLTRIEQ